MSFCNRNSQYLFNKYGVTSRAGIRFANTGIEISIGRVMFIADTSRSNLLHPYSWLSSLGKFYLPRMVLKL